MFQSTKKNGFTLVELLIGIVVVGVLSTITMRMIFNMVNYRSKQYAIEETSDSFRNFILTFSNDVRSSKTLNIIDSGNTVEIINFDNNCIKYHYDSTIQTIQKAEGCSSVYLPILNANKIKIEYMVFSPIRKGVNHVNISIPEIDGIKKGIYKDALGERRFTFNSTVTQGI